MTTDKEKAPKSVNALRGIPDARWYKPKPSIGGGEYITEPAIIRNVSEMYNEIIRSGQYQYNVAINSRNYHGNRAIAEQLLGKGLIERAPNFQSLETKHKLRNIAEEGTRRMKEYQKKQHEKAYKDKIRDEIRQEIIAEGVENA